jgi:SAM-dependent methyltransferase
VTESYLTFEGVPTEQNRRVRERVRAGQLPHRYEETSGRSFFAAARPALVEGATVLDVGSGRRPTLPPHYRPPACTYVGLDVSAEELHAAEPDAYDEIVVASITDRVRELDSRFDLILSWQVLEHVESMEAALDTMHAYLKPGGRMVGLLSGTFAAHSLLGRVVPHRVASRLMERLLSMDPEGKFPTHYNCCHASALDGLLTSWSEHGVIARYKGGTYFKFWRPLERAYLSYENWAERSGRRNLATHYVIWGVK